MHSDKYDVPHCHGVWVTEYRAERHYVRCCSSDSAIHRPGDNTMDANICHPQLHQNRVGLPKNNNGACHPEILDFELGTATNTRCSMHHLLTGHLLATTHWSMQLLEDIDPFHWSHWSDDCNHYNECHTLLSHHTNALEEAGYKKNPPEVRQISSSLINRVLWILRTWMVYVIGGIHTQHPSICCSHLLVPVLLNYVLSVSSTIHIYRYTESQY